ncbi:protein of unassigned function [Methylobacterium oryzae CBMB20]|uniref:Protein of unassigned function n=1 Tax=Methylobacterium oryzae CBMB20 TaxID=693986 RepID=A0A089NPM7_9HYPH|nr:protein of unassigned function [Methylobacterium oryzae CBMB20]
MDITKVQIVMSNALPSSKLSEAPLRDRRSSLGPGPITISGSGSKAP